MTTATVPTLVAIVSNVSRQDTYGQWKDTASLAVSVHSNGWVPSSIILVDHKETATLAHALDTLTSQLEAVEAKKPETKIVLTLTMADGQEQGFSKADVLQRIKAYDATKLYPVAVAGNRRSLAILLLAILGYPVTPATLKVDKAADAKHINILENIASENTLKLNDENTLFSAFQLYQDNSITGPTGMKRFSKGQWGGAQLLWEQCKLLGNYGDKLPNPTATIASFRDKEALRTINAMRPGEALKALKEGVKVSDTPSALTRRKLEPITKKAQGTDLEPILVAIMDGREADADRLVTDYCLAHPATVAATK